MMDFAKSTHCRWRTREPKYNLSKVPHSFLPWSDAADGRCKKELQMLRHFEYHLQKYLTGKRYPCRDNTCAGGCVADQPNLCLRDLLQCCAFPTDPHPNQTALWWWDCQSTSASSFATRCTSFGIRRTCNARHLWGLWRGDLCRCWTGRKCIAWYHSRQHYRCCSHWRFLCKVTKTLPLVLLNEGLQGSDL